MKFGILAGGDGSRLVQEGVTVPKPLVIINGEPLIKRLIRIFQENGAESVSVFVNENMPEISHYLLENGDSFTCDVNYISGHTPSSFHSFAALVDIMKPEDKFVVTTVDTVFNEKAFSGYIDYFREMGDENDGVMAITDYVDDEKPLYILSSEKENDLINGFSDKLPENFCGISAGIYGLRQSALPVIKEGFEAGISRMRKFQSLLVTNGLRLMKYNMGEVVDIDHLKDIEAAEKLISKNLVAL